MAGAHRFLVWLPARCHLAQVTWREKGEPIPPVSRHLQAHVQLPSTAKHWRWPQPSPELWGLAPWKQRGLCRVGESTCFGRRQIALWRNLLRRLLREVFALALLFNPEMAEDGWGESWPQPPQEPALEVGISLPPSVVRLYILRYS